MIKAGSETKTGFHFQARFDFSTSDTPAVWRILRHFLEEKKLAPERLIVKYHVRIFYKNNSNKYVDDVKSREAGIHEVLEIVCRKGNLPGFSLSSIGTRNISISVNREGMNMTCRELQLESDDFDRLAVSLANGIDLRNAVIETTDFSMNLHMRYRDDEYVRTLCSQPSGRYEHTIGHEMWFGDSFWDYTACSKKDILNADWLKVEDRGNHRHVVAWPEPFNSTKGEQGEIQRRLLKLLFGK